VDLGGGTGRTLGFLGPRLERLGHAHVVDVSPSLLAVARSRIDAAGWRNVTLHEADATDPPLPPGSADVVLFSYSLTMIPDWFRAVDRALLLLKPGGLIAVVDFYVSRKRAAPFTQHGPLTRWLTRLWFSYTDVHVSPDHLPYLLARCDPISLVEGRHELPLPFRVRVPVYRFIGRVRRNTNEASS
jgi:S-adenosylmethionine-diacylgycerolhomoserine-N-methlytransferase